MIPGTFVRVGKDGMIFALDSMKRVVRSGCNRLPGGFRTGQTAPGFTLVELLLATFISALVIAIASVSLSFSLRIWERNQYRDPPSGAQLLDLLQLQIGSFYPFQVRYEGGKRTILSGDGSSLLLATGYSVRALSKGAPVLARYVFNEQTHKIYYAEIPLDPYHEERTKDFVRAAADEDKDGPFRFYAIEAAQWEFGYRDPESDDFSDAWDKPTGLPSSIRVMGKWKDDAPEWTRIITLGFLFPEGNRTQ